MPCFYYLQHNADRLAWSRDGRRCDVALDSDHDRSRLTQSIAEQATERALSLSDERPYDRAVLAVKTSCETHETVVDQHVLKIWAVTA